MQDFIKNLAALIKVKTLVTITVLIVFAVLSLNGTLKADSIMNIVIMVVSFYFGTQLEQK